MSRKGTFVGGHTVLTQQPREYEAELERAATRARKRKEWTQREFDNQREHERNRVLARIRALDEETNNIDARRRMKWTGYRSDKDRRKGQLAPDRASSQPAGSSEPSEPTNCGISPEARRSPEGED